jgi:hypothetical protein
MIYAYFDETGQNTKDWVFVGGFAGREERWRRCANEWSSVLREFQRTRLHMHELRWKKQSTQRLLARLGPIPTECGLYRVIGGVNVSHYSDLVPGSASKVLNAGYIKCLTPLVLALLQSLPPDERVEIVFETQDRYSSATNYVLSEWARGISSGSPEFWEMRTSDGRPKLTKWSFAPKHGTPLLDLADYLLYATLQWHRDEKSIKSQYCRPIITDPGGGCFHIGRVFSRDEIRAQLVVERKRQMPVVQSTNAFRFYSERPNTLA